MKKSTPTVGDFLLIKNKTVEIIGIDLDGDYWVEYEKNLGCFKESQTKFIFTGTSLINAQNTVRLPCFDLIPKGTFNHDIDYVLIREYSYKITKIILTKLVKKLYNLPEDFSKNLYSMEDLK